MNPLSKFVEICWKDCFWSKYQRSPFYEIFQDLSLEKHGRFYYQAAGSHLPSLPLAEIDTHYYSDVDYLVLDRVVKKLRTLEEYKLIQNLVINSDNTILEAEYVYQNIDRKIHYSILPDKVKIQFPSLVGKVDVIYEQRSAGIVHKLDFWREVDRTLAKGGFLIGIGEQKGNPSPQGHSFYYLDQETPEIEILLSLPAKYPYLDYSEDLGYKILLERINEHVEAYTWVQVPLHHLGFILKRRILLNKEGEDMFVFQKTGSSQLEQVLPQLERYEFVKPPPSKSTLRNKGRLMEKPRAVVVQVHKSKPIMLPKRFLDWLNPKLIMARTMLVLINPTMRNFRLIPTKSPSVIKVAIEIRLLLDPATKSYREVPSDFLQELGVVFIRNNIKTLYSSGIPLYFNPYQKTGWIYEGYIDSADLTISNAQLRRELLKIKNVSQVEITTHTP